ncbi:MAG: cell division protein FtsL [Deltaproteobacteria bacterium HGW-Deltaproteobacteria-23]|nr:MAG: cell division protein FtsL [Deltaproteobacteria bacterium HGW-Deltaproteobacteria-23]
MAHIRATMDKVADPRRFETAAEEKSDLFVYLIGIIVIVTAVSVFHVWSRVRVMDLNLQVGELRRELKAQEQEQGRLKLEVASLKMPARIETLATGELGMSLPTEQQVVQVK